jgi:hypothetical protein
MEGRPVNLDWLRALALMFVLSPALLGCALPVHHAYSGAVQPDAELAIVRSVGDTGFRIDRTVANAGPAPYLYKVNGTATGDFTIGFPSTVKLPPGAVTLVVYCALPFEEFFFQTLNETLVKGTVYELRCERSPGFTNRAWLQAVRAE